MGKIIMRIVILIYVVSIFYLLWFRPFGGSDDTAWAIMISLIFFVYVIVKVIIILKNIHENPDFVITEKINQKSYIDEDTGTIYLRSHDYHTVRGEEWVVSDNSLTINKNSIKEILDKSDTTKGNFGTISQIIPLSKIHTMELNNKGTSGILSYKILENFRVDIAGDGSGSAGTREEIRPTLGGQIRFFDVDANIIQAVCDRVSSATIRK